MATEPDDGPRETESSYFLLIFCCKGIFNPTGETFVPAAPARALVAPLPPRTRRPRARAALLSLQIRPVRDHGRDPLCPHSPHVSSQRIL